MCFGSATHSVHRRVCLVWCGGCGSLAFVSLCHNPPCVCCCADKGEADHARSSKGAFKASSKRSVGAEAENLRYTTRREILTHSVRLTVHLRFDSYFHCLCASGLVPMCVQRVQAAVVKDVVSAPVKSKSVHGGDVLLEKLSPYVRRVLPAALAAFLDKVVVTPEDGEKRDRA